MIVLQLSCVAGYVLNVGEPLTSPLKWRTAAMPWRIIVNGRGVFESVSEFVVFLLDYYQDSILIVVSSHLQSCKREANIVELACATFTNEVSILSAQVALKIVAA